MCTKYNNNEIAKELNTPYTMHTATLKMRLTSDDMKRIKEVMFEELDKKENVRKHFKKETKYKTDRKFLVTEKWGFNYVRIVKCKVKDVHYYWMEIKINPRAMLHNRNYPFVYVASREDIKASIEILNQFWKEIGLDWIDSRLFYIHRIDYCVNISVGDEDSSNIYMRLMRKGAYPYKSKRMKEYSETGKRYIDTINSFTVTSGSFEFSVYSKYKQLKSEKEKYSAEEIDQALGVIRIELRVYRNKVKREETKHDVQGIEELLDITSQVAQENIPRYLAETYGTGIFVTIQEARKRVDATNWKKKTKEKMKSILKLVSRLNLQDAKEEYEKEFPKYMKKFNEIGISPITIASNCAYKKMPNPLFYIENNTRNNEKQFPTINSGDIH